MGLLTYIPNSASLPFASQKLDTQTPAASAAVAWDILEFGAIDLTLDGTHVLTMPNPPAAGFVASRRMLVVKGVASDDITWPAYIQNSVDFDVSTDAVGTYIYGIDCYNGEGYIVGKAKVV